MHGLRRVVIARNTVEELEMPILASHYFYASQA